MSDIDVTNGKTMVILVPLDKSDEVKTVLIDKKIYQNMFRPKRISNSLALPIKNNYQNLHQELTVLFRHHTAKLPSAYYFVYVR